MNEPFTVFVVSEESTHQVSPVEMDALLQGVETWEEEQIRQFLE